MGHRRCNEDAIRAERMGFCFVLRSAVYALLDEGGGPLWWNHPASGTVTLLEGGMQVVGSIYAHLVLSHRIHMC